MLLVLVLVLVLVPLARSFSPPQSLGHWTQ